ncbi:kinase-like domain-containing protein [Mycena amicta]|nr:kinase-like domain-containing protein [Mycena amicta]
MTSESTSPAAAKRSLQDFQLRETLGEGAYSTVKLATSRVDGNHYAVKVVSKAHLQRARKVQTATAERNALVCLRRGGGHPGVVCLHAAFVDEWNLYFVLDYAPNGHLQALISRLGSLSTTCVRYYTAQIADALAFIHSRGVLHRDLKPENILLDERFRIKIVDFGTAKVLEGGEQHGTTFVGTAQYQAPELLERNETSRSSDYWALGCILYELASGHFPFNDRTVYLTWQKIKRVEYEFPDVFDEQGRDLVKTLLVRPFPVIAVSPYITTTQVRDPTQRLGAGPPGSTNDPSALRAHPFLSSIIWSSLWTDAAPPMEAGFFRKVPSESRRTDDDVWDELVDGIEWLSLGAEEEAEGGDLVRR